MDRVLDGGFADPVTQAQAAFRAVMDALANPCTAQTLVTPHSGGSTLTPELASVLLTLTDPDSPIWLDDTLAGDADIVAFIRFHTGAPIVADPVKAAFALVSGLGNLPPFESFNRGTQEYPDRSTTIVLAVPALTGGPALTLRGPGIKDDLKCHPAGLPEDFVTQWAANCALFPRGIDLLLVADGQVMGLPRSTRIEEA